MLSDMNPLSQGKATEIVEEYVSSLQDLKSNSKPYINMLTQLAEDYIEYASAIVAAVEVHLLKVRNEIKLPVLYLIDSIVKNLGGSYLELFSKNIVQTFCKVFEKVDESTRSKMWKLRNTWNDIFPAKQLYDLDVQVNNIDPAWPIVSVAKSLPTSAPKHVIHVNPQFLQNAPKPVAEVSPSKPAPYSGKTVLDKIVPDKKLPSKQIEIEASLQEQKMRDELLRKHEELKKLELKKQELEQAALQHRQTITKSDKFANCGSSKVPMINKPSTSSNIVDNLDKKSVEKTLTIQSRAKLTTPSLHPTDPRKKTVAALQNGNIEPSLPSSSHSKPKSCSPTPKTHTSPRISSPPPPLITKLRDRSISPIKVEPRNPSPPLSPTKSSSSSSTKRRRSSKSSPHKKSRKRSHSPDEHRSRHHRHHRQHRPKDQSSADEEKSGGSISLSPQSVSPEKSGRSRKRTRESKSPEITCKEESKRKDCCDNKDEDLRVAAIAMKEIKDLDLRVLPPIPSKRQPTDTISSQSKKSKSEVFDELFGKEDVDLRLLAPVTKTAQLVTSALPSVPPPPKISNDLKDNDSDSRSKFEHSRNDSNRSSIRDRPSRQKAFNKTEKRGNREYSERNSDRNIEIIMKQAAEQLNQGTITKAQYNKLIQEVLHMSEDQKLKAAQRKEWESKGWERGDKGLRGKDHGMHPRVPGPRWQSPWHQPWTHGPGSFGTPPFRPPDFRPMGPWQSHPRLFGPGPMRPDFHHQFHSGYNPRLGPPPMGPNGPIMLPNPMLGPMGPIATNLMMPVLSKRFSTSPDLNNKNEVDEMSSSSSGSNTPVTNVNNDDLPPADLKMVEEIEKDSMKSINIDNVPREIRYYDNQGVIFMHWNDPRDIGFQNGARKIYIDGKEVAVCSFNDDFREFNYDGTIYRIKLGAPTRELFINDKWYQCYFGGASIPVELNGKKVNVKLDGPAPQVKIGQLKRTDLVIGKINLIINARSMVPVFLDAKPQLIEIEGKPIILKFIDSLKVVLLNGKAFPVEFGGLPKPVVIQGKKHFLRFSALPMGFKAGYVKIAGMEGEQPKEMEDQRSPASLPQLENSNNSVPSPIEPDSGSQDGIDQSYIPKSDLRLDVLSSAVPSAMAPSSGLSYQTDLTIENASALSAQLPLNLNELYQKLVETGIVTNLLEPKKPEEEEKKIEETVQVSFDKPESLKLRNPAVIETLYSGIQCGSCPDRFAPEMATHYSHHLDWHFRQNRKEKESSKKAHSRTWYYEFNEWAQFEEIEDLEDRAQSWFEIERQTMENENATTEDVFPDTMQPTVPAGMDDDAFCQVCREAFEQFYHDEKEEWHLRPAISFDNKNFHPICLEDYKEKLFVKSFEDEHVLSPPLSPAPNDNETNNVDDDPDVDKLDVKLEAEETNENNCEMQTMSDDISLEKIKCEPAEELVEPEMEEPEKNNSVVKANLEGSDTETNCEHEMATLVKEEILTPYQHIDDTNISKSIEDQSSNLTTESSNDCGAADESTIRTSVDSTQVEVKSTIDGNVELESSISAVPATQSKIKINITKPIGTMNESAREKTHAKEEPNAIEEELEVPPKPKSIKPAIRNKELKVLSKTVCKGEELSGLCSVM
ncbi:pre-mRNA cleavage complex 2 protein Pcf11-like isoform X2 [Trichogramma pretiosum]|uniref:pre-mRNA cleavage complex 2 protein Pcf11-like isoform X2 n=1 Tax=Trichogramma pretiosum TaxID=7493 RepID=UPI0006C99A71|nr:pre-mRNA cleavage complex 2 protein Pcf11-like isoform X2 [Trichogramma pretiosum]